MRHRGLQRQLPQLPANRFHASQGTGALAAMDPWNLGARPYGFVSDDVLASGPPWGHACGAAPAGYTQKSPARHSSLTPALRELAAQAPSLPARAVARDRAEPDRPLILKPRQRDVGLRLPRYRHHARPTTSAARR